MTTKPLYEASDVDFGVPNFADATADRLKNDTIAALAAQRETVAAIAADPSAPTFENTIAPLDDSELPLHRVLSMLFTLASSMGTDEMQDLEGWAGEQLAEHSAALTATPGLVDRVRAVLDSSDFDELPIDAQRLTKDRYRSLRHAGADLDQAGQQRLLEINREQARVGNEFAKKLVACANEAAVKVADISRLESMGRDAVDIAVAAASDKGLDGALLTLNLPTGQAQLPSLSDRSLRKELMDASLTRNQAGGEYDTSELLLTTIRLRAEQAELLGFNNFAELRLDGAMAPSVGEVTEMLQRIVKGAVASVHQRAERLREAAAEDGVTDFAAHDWDYYDEAISDDAESDVDLDDVSEYFELNRLITDGLFRAANILYGVSFTQAPQITGWNEDVDAYECHDADGSFLGVVLCDWYARDIKRGGAWMADLVPQSTRLNTTPVVTLNLNLRKPPAGRPTLLDIDENVTAFHEFGHVLHGLLSNVRFVGQAGTSVPRDFVEYPSQVNEMWLAHPEILPFYAVHHSTGEPLPRDKQEALRAARSQSKPKSTLEISAAAWLDWSWHLLTSEQARAIEDPAAFEAEVLSALGVPTDLVPPRYRSNYFQHLFQGYGAAYYSYLWSEVLDADTSQWFWHSLDLSESGRLFREKILAIGDSADQLASYEEMMDRAPDDTAFFTRHGLL